MNDGAFEAQVADVLARVAALRARAGRATDADARTLLDEGLEELGTALEELNVAQEELRVQNEAIAAAEAVADAERERYQALFEHAPNGYVVTDEDGVVRRANVAAGTLFGTAARYLVGKPLAVLVHPEDKRDFLALLSALRTGDEPQGQEVRVLPRPEGTAPRVADLTVARFKDPETLGRGLRWQFRDVTAHRQADEDLRRLTAELEDRVRQRTADLTRVEAELRQADKRKDEFLATMAHELRNPLGAIRAAAELLRARGGLPESALSAVGVIDRQARRITDLVTDLLDATRIAEGKLRLRREPIDLAEACRGVVEAARAASAGLEVAVEVDADPIRVEADPTRVDQVVSNLVTNAIKYTDPGGKVTVRVERKGPSAVVRVRDTGVGIAADILPKVFDLFVQVSNDRSQGGLGIGLHLVKRLVELHGGSVEAHSAGPGQGSEFVVRFPALADSSG
jgi:PAS domain S-box-containing protein